MTAMNGRWKDAREWLKEQVRRWNVRRLERKFHELADNFSEHELQKIYALELEADGFFQDVIDPTKIIVGAEVRIAKWTDCEHLAGQIGKVTQIVPDKTLGVQVEFWFLRSDDKREWFAPNELVEVKYDEVEPEDTP